MESMEIAIVPSPKVSVVHRRLRLRSFSLILNIYNFELTLKLQPQVLQ